MEFDIILIQQAFDGELLDEFTTLARKVFGGANRENLLWRLERMPDVTFFAAKRDNSLIGFKVGYAATTTRYYSWLGGVDPLWRSKGVARELMIHQHRWLKESDYSLVETSVNQDNNAMVSLNLSVGFKVSGMQIKRGVPAFIMHKEV